MSKTKAQLRTRRKARSRAKLRGTATRPRLVVHRSLRGLVAQLVDDDASVTIAAASDRDAKAGAESGDRAGKVAMAYQVGQALAAKAKKKKISTIVFDRSGNKYHGRIKALAEGARDGGLKF